MLGESILILNRNFGILAKKVRLHSLGLYEFWLFSTKFSDQIRIYMALSLGSDFTMNRG